MQSYHNQNEYQLQSSERVQPVSRRVDAARGSGQHISPVSLIRTEKNNISIDGRGATTQIKIAIYSGVWRFEPRCDRTHIREKIAGNASESHKYQNKNQNKIRINNGFRRIIGGAIIHRMRAKIPTATENNEPTLHGEDKTKLAPGYPGAGGEWVITTRLPSLRGGRGSDRLEMWRAYQFRSYKRNPLKQEQKKLNVIGLPRYAIRPGAPS